MAYGWPVERLLICTCSSRIVKGFGASKPPEEGTVSIHQCLWGELNGSGYYYGSDGVRRMSFRSRSGRRRDSPHLPPRPSFSAS